MFLSRPLSWFGCCLAGVFLVAGCVSDGGPSGSLDLELVLENGAEIDEVFWRITDLTGDKDPMEGVIDTSASPGPAVRFALEVPAGENYLMKLWATSEDGKTTCEGWSAEFDVVAGMHTPVHVKLRCRTEPGDGAVLVEGWINICAQLSQLAIAPTKTSVGNHINLHAVATDDDGDDDDIDYLWTATGGTIADPTAQDTTYTCEEEGDQWITIEVSDEEGCLDSETVEVTCVDGGGMGGTDGGMGGMDGGMGGMDGGMGGAGGEGGVGGMAGAGGAGGEGGAGGTGGTAGTGGVGGVGGGTGGAGGGICIPDGGAQHAGPADRRCEGSGSCGALEVCVDETCAGAALVFVSSTGSDAALGGPRGADKICAELAREAGLGGYWMSWTSDSCTSPRQRFEASILPYRLLSGTLIANDWTDLTDDYLENPIDMDEMGNVIVGTDPAFRDTLVWTNTEPNGARHSNNGCRGLRTNDIGGVNGVPVAVGSTTSTWIPWTVWSTPPCSTVDLRIYCFEQSVNNQ